MLKYKRKKSISTIFFSKPMKVVSHLLLFSLTFPFSGFPVYSRLTNMKTLCNDGKLTEEKFPIKTSLFSLSGNLSWEIFALLKKNCETSTIELSNLNESFFAFQKLPREFPGDKNIDEIDSVHRWCSYLRILRGSVGPLLRL